MSFYSNSHFLFQDYYSARDIKRIEDRITYQQRRAKRSSKKDKERIDQLERDVAFLALMNKTLLDLVVDSTIISKEEILDKMSELDMLDGVRDGGLDVNHLAEEVGLDILKDLPADDEPKS